MGRWDSISRLNNKKSGMNHSMPPGQKDFNSLVELAATRPLRNDQCFAAS
jgi:hypothetical protein